MIPHQDYKMITLEVIQNIETAARPSNVKKKLQAYFCDQTDIEYILHTTTEFEDIAGHCFHLSTRPSKFEHFRECLVGSVCNNWDIACINQSLGIGGPYCSLVLLRAASAARVDYETKKLA